MREEIGHERSSPFHRDARAPTELEDSPRQAGRAVAVATAVNWGAAFLVSQFFFSVIGAVGDSMTSRLFAFFCAVSCVWVYFRVPETKGQSLELVQALCTEAKT